MLTDRPLTPDPELSSETENLHEAAADCSLDAVKELLQSKADVNAVDYRGLNALQLAILCDDEAVAKERVSVISALLDAKADTEHADFDGYTALLLLVENETHSMQPLKRLLEVPSLNFNAVTTPSTNENRMGNSSALHLAINRAKPLNEEFVKTLLESGKLDLEIRSEDGVTPLGLAITENAFPLVKLLIEAKANPDNTGLKNENETSAFQPTGTNILILAKIYKIRKLLALPFGYGIPEPLLYKEYFAAWLSVGAGRKYLSYATDTSEKFKALLNKYSAQPAYELALATDEFLTFFNSFPDIFTFFANELQNENSLLEQMHDIFFEGLKKPAVTRSNTATFDYAAPFEWKIDAPSHISNKHISEKICLRPSDSHDEKLPNVEVSIEEYKTAISELGIKVGVEMREDSLLDPAKRVKNYINELRKLKISDLSIFSNPAKTPKSPRPHSSVLNTMLDMLKQPNVLLANNMIFHFGQPSAVTKRSKGFNNFHV